MLTRIFWIDFDGPGRLAIMPRPRGGDWLSAEIIAWTSERIDVVVSLLESEEVQELDLRQEGDACGAAGIEFLSLPIKDRGVPTDRRALVSLTTVLLERLRSGKSVAIHCRAGIGRSSVVAACTLIQAGQNPGDALVRIVASRGLTCPDTDEQRDWIVAFRAANLS